MITFLTSAFWHGVAGGYYLAFAFGGFVQTAMRLCRSNFRPLFLTTSTSTTPVSNATANGSGKSAAPQLSPTPLKPLYDAASILVSVLVLNFTAAPFMLLTIKDSFRCWSRLGWYGAVLVFGSLAFFWSGGGRLFKAKSPAKGSMEDGQKK
jgi:lysophospholipid acyltransferase